MLYASFFITQCSIYPLCPFHVFFFSYAYYWVFFFSPDITTFFFLYSISYHFSFVLRSFTDSFSIVSSYSCFYSLHMPLLSGFVPLLLVYLDLELSQDSHLCNTFYFWILHFQSCLYPVLPFHSPFFCLAISHFNSFSIFLSSFIIISCS